MKKSFLFIFALLLASAIYGQRTFESRHSRYQWVYQYLNFGIPEKNIIDTISRDTTIVNGKMYRKFSNFFVREEAKKVYVLRNLLPTTTEYIVFDFNKNINDTFDMNIEGVKYKIAVEDKFRVEIDNDSLIYMKVSTVDTLRKVQMSWLESVGCISSPSANLNPINWPSTFPYQDIGFKLICYLKDGDTSLLSYFNINCLNNNLLDPAKTWYGYGVDTISGSAIKGYKFIPDYSKDTTVNGIQYIWMTQPRHFGRYDGVRNAYYALSDIQDEEILVFKNNPSIGDTIYKTPGANGRFEIVRAIDKGFFANSYRRVYTTDGDKFYSGLGSLNINMWDRTSNRRNGYRSSNICYHEDYKLAYQYFDYKYYNTCDLTASTRHFSMSEIELNWTGNQIELSSNRNWDANARLAIYDQTGKTIYSQTIVGSRNQNIHTGPIAAGFYIVHLIDRDQIVTKKYLRH